MKCYTLTEKEIRPGVLLEGLPTDGSFGKNVSAESVKIVILIKERDGIVPDELLDADAGRATACGRVVLSKSGKDSKGRFAVLYDPRQWFLDPSTGKDGFIVHRSRTGFIAVSRGKGFLMRSADGSMRLAPKDGSPSLRPTGKEPVRIPKPDEGWTLATME
jgi:hypothetical protein